MPIITAPRELEHLRIPDPHLWELAWASVDELDLSKIKAPANRFHNKPFGGLWLAPPREGGGNEWTYYLEREDWNPFDFDHCVVQRVGLAETANILLIDCLQDFQEVLSAYPNLSPLRTRTETIEVSFIDYEAVSREWDGIYLTSEGEAATRYNEGDFGIGPLYGWDFESVVVFRPEAIATVGEFAEYELAFTPWDQ